MQARTVQCRHTRVGSSSRPLCLQRARKRRSTSAARVLTSSKVKNTAKVKVKAEPEPADEVTCSTDDVRRHQSTAAEKDKTSDEALLPDTTTENVDDVRHNVITRQSASNGIVVDAADNRGVVPQQQQQQPAVPAFSHVGQSYHGPYQHHYVNYVHQAAPPYRRDDDRPALFVAAGREQRYHDDIDDVLSVMASVAGVSHHLHLSNY